jgi:TonB family protein
MRLRKMKILLLLAIAVFATLTASEHALAQENATPQTTSANTPLKIGGDVLPPVLTHSANPKFPRGFRTTVGRAVVRVGLIVDTAGKPTKIHIIKSLDPNLDKNCMDAVAKYRFKPATLHGQPVPVELVVEVTVDTFN